jgi:hypothetical protein
MARIPAGRRWQPGGDTMKLASVHLLPVWHALGGGPLRGKRGNAFWRGGDGLSVALDLSKGKWYDHRDGRGGGVLALVETALGCDRRTALQWLETNCGIDPFRPLSVDDWRNYWRERKEAVHFGIAAKALAEEILDQLDASDPTRAVQTQMLAIIRADEPVLIEEYRMWRQNYPELTRALVRAGASSRARSERRLAFYLLELSNAA